MVRAAAGLSRPERRASRLVGVALRLHLPGRAAADSSGHVARGMGGRDRGCGEQPGGLGCGTEVSSDGGRVGDYVGMQTVFHVRFLMVVCTDGCPSQCCASAYLSYFFMDCMMSRWLVL